MNRPTCVHCGKPYGKRKTKSEYLIWACGELAPEQTSPGESVRVSMFQKAPHSSRGTFMGKPYTENDNVAVREVWNGEWLTSYDPFCTLRCAYDYARIAYTRQKIEREQKEHDEQYNNSNRWRER